MAARAMEREARRGRQGQKTRAIGRREAESSASIDAIGARETKVAASAMERGRGEGGDPPGELRGGVGAIGARGMKVAAHVIESRLKSMRARLLKFHGELFGGG